jgi:hypothetical protein
MLWKIELAHGSPFPGLFVTEQAALRMILFGFYPGATAHPIA